MLDWWVGWLHGNTATAKTIDQPRTRSKGERPCKAGRRRPRAKPLSFALPLLLSQLRQPLFLFRLTGSFASLHFSLVRFLSRSHFRSMYPLPILRLHVRHVTRGYVTSNLPSCTAYIENCRLTYRERGYQRAHPAFRSTLGPGEKRDRVRKQGRIDLIRLTMIRYRLRGKPNVRAYDYFSRSREKKNIFFRFGR